MSIVRALKAHASLSTLHQPYQPCLANRRRPLEKARKKGADQPVSLASSWHLRLASITCLAWCPCLGSRRDWVCVCLVCKSVRRERQRQQKRQKQSLRVPPQRRGTKEETAPTTPAPHTNPKTRIHFLPTLSLSTYSKPRDLPTSPQASRRRQDPKRPKMPPPRSSTTTATTLALCALLVATTAAAAAATPAHGGGKGAVSSLCTASKSAWSSAAKCSAFKTSLCETVQACGGA